MAQYSIPFSVALSAYRDPRNPSSFIQDAITDPDICDLSKRISMDVLMINKGPATGWGVGMSINLKDGNRLFDDLDIFEGCPERPLSKAALSDKFSRRTDPLIAGAGRQPWGGYE